MNPVPLFLIIVTLPLLLGDLRDLLVSLIRLKENK
jgi:hypothetical protein